MQHIINIGSKENISNKYLGVMLSHGKFNVVVAFCETAGLRLTHVVCPFKSRKLRFVDMLDHALKEAGLKGVLSYDRNDELTCICISDTDTDPSLLFPIVEGVLQDYDELMRDEVNEEDVTAMREFLLLTRCQWITKTKYYLLNSIVNEMQARRH